MMVPHPCKKKVIADTFSCLLHCNMLPIPVGEIAPVVLFDFISKGLDISDDSDQLKILLNLPLLNDAVNNPVDLM